MMWKLALVVLVGCATSRQSGETYRIDVSAATTRNEALRRAGELCPDGFDVVDGDAGGADTSLTVRCKPRVEVPPRGPIEDSAWGL